MRKIIKIHVNTEAKHTGPVDYKRQIRDVVDYA